MIETITLAILLTVSLATSANLLWLIAHRRGFVEASHTIPVSTRRAILIAADGFRDQEILTQATAIAGLVVVAASLYVQLEVQPEWNWTVWTDAPWYSRAISYSLGAMFALHTASTISRRRRWHQLEGE